MNFKGHLLTILATIYCLVDASPVEVNKNAKSQLAKFDDLKNPSPLVALTEVGTYRDLNYDNFLLITLGLTGLDVAGVRSPSPSNVIGFGFVTQTLNGSPTITVADSADSFDLDSFYFGCAVNTRETVASVPTGCIVAATPYDNYGKKLPSQSFEFKPNGLLVSDMVQTKLKGWKQLSKVEFENEGLVDSVLTAASFGNFKYTVKK